MRDFHALDPRNVPLYGALGAAIAAIALLLALGPAAGGRAEAALPKSENSRKLAADECRLDQRAHAPTCKMQGRTVRVIRF